MVAIVVGIAGMTTLWSAAFAAFRGQIEVLTDVVPLSVRYGATSAAALAGLGLLVIAGGLSRRQRRAWWIALMLLIVAGVAHVLKGLDVPEAAVNLGTAVLLISTREEFYAIPGPGSARRAFLALPLIAGTVWTFGTLALFFHASELRPAVGVIGMMTAAARGAVGLPLGIAIVGRSGRWIPGLLPLLGVLGLVSAFAVTLRPVVEGLRRSPDDVERARELVRRYGSDTLAYFALRSDKSYFFYENAFIAYRYLWNVALVAGDPIGDPMDVTRALDAFVAYGRSRGWGIVILAGSDELADNCRRHGLRQFYLGDEAILDPRKFSLEGRAIRKVRQSRSRLAKLGYSLEFMPDDRVTPDLQDALDSITASWRGRAPERGFTMALGRTPSPTDPDALTVIARDPLGKAQGYLHLVPCYGESRGYSLDQMRRRPETPNGMTEWMVAGTTLELGERDVERFSLNFAFLSRLFDRSVNLSVFQRLELAIAKALNPFFQIETLRDFNAKFFPEWQPRNVYYESTISIPRVALAYLEAEAFLRLPLMGIRGRRT
ncbi:MAG: lysyl-tRNA synthetase, class [Actinomycetota bacterium]|nr:lysyl-tRNA synthetase, class [Actinomycetota bacterium]